MKASRYSLELLGKSQCDWCMHRCCVTKSSREKETIEHAIRSGLSNHSIWIAKPDNAEGRNKDDMMTPYLQRHFIFIDYAKYASYVGCGKVTNLPSCVLEFIRDQVPDKKGLYRGRTLQLFGNISPVREVLLMESERALRCIRTAHTYATNPTLYYSLPCDCTLQNYNNGYIEKNMEECFVKRSSLIWQGLVADLLVL